MSDVLIKLEALKVQHTAMKAANYEREIHGLALAYPEETFMDLSNEILSLIDVPSKEKDDVGKVDLLNTSVRSLGLNPKIVSVLESNCIFSLKNITELTYQEFLMTKGLRFSEIEEVENKIQNMNLSFRNA